MKTAKKATKQYVRFYYLRYSEDTFFYDTTTWQTKLQKKVRAGTPAALIGSTVDRDKGTISFAVSIVHPKDSFSKETARNYVRGGLKRRAFTIDLPKDAAGYEINCAIMKAILSDDECERMAQSLIDRNATSPNADESPFEWAMARLKHAGLRKLASEWLARPRWEEKPDLMQTMKDAIAKDPAIKNDPKLLVDLLQTAGVLDERHIGLKELLAG